MSQQLCAATALCLALFATVSLTACRGVPATPNEFELHSVAMGKPMGYSIYAPPGWTADEELPLVVLLHGGGGDHLDFYRYELDEYFDHLYAAGDLPRSLIVNPNGELGFWENWADGSKLYRDWVVKDLMPHISSKFHTASCPANCHIMGVSMGGHGALRFAFYEADMFATVSVISAPVLSRDTASKQFGGFIGWFVPHERIWGDMSDPTQSPPGLDPFVGWTSDSVLRSKSLYLAWGSGDRAGIKESNEKFATALDASGFAYTKSVYDGDHKWVDWRHVIADAIAQQVPTTSTQHAIP